MRLTLDEVLAATGGRLVARLGEKQAEGSTEFARVATDTREDLTGCLFVALKGERFDGHAFLGKAAEKGASGVLISHGEIPAGLVGVEVPDTLSALGDLGRWVRRKLGLRVGAITGSFGKTTTKDMAVAMLRAGGRRVLATPGNLNNLIGLPLTLLSARGDEEVAVLELGISVPGEMARLSAICEPDVALVTGVGAAHTEGLGDVAGVAAEKLEIAKGLREGGLLLVPKSDPRLAPGAGVRTETFGWEEGADLRAEAPVFRGAAGSEIRVDGRKIAVPVPGRHNARNALAAWALVRALGMTPGPEVEPLAKLGAAPLRGEIRRSPRGVNLLVDCYNANPEAVGAALETLAELAGSARKFVVLGEMRELGALTEEAHREVGRRAAKAGASGLFLFGEAARFSAEAAREAGMDGETINIYSTREELTRALDATINAGDWVLIKGSRATRLDEVADALAPAAGKQDKRCCIA